MGLELAPGVDHTEIQPSGLEDGILCSSMFLLQSPLLISDLLAGSNRDNALVERRVNNCGLVLPALAANVNAPLPPETEQVAGEAGVQDGLPLLMGSM